MEKKKDLIAGGSSTKEIKIKTFMVTASHWTGNGKMTNADLKPNQRIELESEIKREEDNRNRSCRFCPCVSKLEQGATTTDGGDRASGSAWALDAVATGVCCHEA